MSRLPFTIKVLICFFAFDALANGAILGVLVATGNARHAHGVSDRLFPLILALCFDLLLAAQLALRTRAGRFWSIVYLAASTGLGLFLLVVEPARWVELTAAGRARELASYGVRIGFLFALLSRRATRALVR